MMTSKSKSSMMSASITKMSRFLLLMLLLSAVLAVSAIQASSAGKQRLP